MLYGAMIHRLNGNLALQDGWGALELGSSHGDCPYVDPGLRVRFLVLLLKNQRFCTGPLS